MSGGYANSMSSATTELYRSIELPETEAQDIELLVTRGADINWRDPKREGASPLHVAITANNLKVFESLLAHGADLGASMLPNLNSPLHVASQEGKFAFVSSILRHAKLKSEESLRHHINAQNQYHNTPLHSAAMAGSLEVVKALVEAGANVKALNSRKSLPLHFAAYADSDNSEVISLLIKHGSDLTAEDMDGHTPLDVAVIKGHQKCVEILLKHNADPHHRDHGGKSAIDHAERKGHKEIMRLLEQVK